tara:strand:+ start:149 stop:2191 length:2043 start_codon:yes stop_codon:yes gene_type:complete
MKKLLYILLFIPFTFLGQGFLAIEQDSPLELNQGWNMIGFTCYEPKEVIEAFTPIDDKITIVKDNSGNVYMPEFAFNGIGDLERGRGYQIKLTEAITDFQFCPFLVPLVEGCMDETAFNYNSSANMDDGSCYPVVLGCLDPSAFNYNDYDNDGFSNEITGTNGVDVNTSYGFCLPVVNGCIDVNADNYSTSANTDNGSCIYFGCVDIEACNYDTEANTDDNSCEYPNPGYDCFGNDLENCYYPDFLSVLWFNENHPELMNGPCLKINEANNYLSLRIDGSNLDSIPWLEHFTNIFTLEIWYNDSLISLPELSGLTNLFWLEIVGNDALISFPGLLPSSISSLLFQSNSSLTSIPEFSGTNLGFLDISGNNSLTSIPELSGQTNLDILIIANNNISTLPELSELTNLSQLYVYNNPSLTTLPELSGLINLSILDIQNNDSLTILEFSGLSNLMRLDILGNDGLTSISLLSDLPNLGGLYITSNNSLTSISGLSELTNLVTLQVESNSNLQCITGGYPEQLAINEEWPPVCTYEVGDLAEGGIVFYVDESGEHGLVAAMEDLEGSYQWGCFGTSISGADGTSIGTGLQNTLEIVAGCSETPIAASEALAYESEGYSDWFLPSKTELIELLDNIVVDSPGIYWSSSETDSTKAWVINVEDLGIDSYLKNELLPYIKVRPIRSF